MNPDLSLMTIEREAKTAYFLPRSHDAFAAALLDSPGAATWLVEYLKNNPGILTGIAVIDINIKTFLKKFIDTRPAFN